MKSCNKWLLGALLLASSQLASAATLTFNGIIDSCVDDFQGFACQSSGVGSGGNVDVFLSTPEGPGIIAAGDVLGFNPVNQTVAPAVPLAIQGLGTAFSFATGSTLELDSNNNPVGGSVELTFEQTQDGLGTPIIRTFFTTLFADGSFSTEARNGPLTDPLLLTVTGTGTWTASPAEVPLPAAVWLFGSGLFGLIAASRRRRRAVVS